MKVKERHIFNSMEIKNPTVKHTITNTIQKEKSDEVQLTQRIKKKQTIKEKAKAFYAKFKTAIVATFSALIAAGSVFAVLTGENKALKKENSKLIEEEITLRRNNSNLKNRNWELENEKAELEYTNELLQEKLKTISLPKEYEKILETKREEIKTRDLDYTEKDIKEDKQVLPRIKIGILMPTTPAQTKNRENMIDLNIPKFKSGEKYTFELPMSDEIKITKESKPFKPSARQATTISENYADSLNWNNQKIARDLLQNFFDGHGQTLDGVKLNVTPNTDGTHKVRIEGLSTYSVDKAFILGESSKKNNKRAAGQFGEGLKMVVLKLLKEKGAKEVNIASNDWLVKWSLEKNTSTNSKVMAYEIKENEPVDGNYIEFDTNNEDLINTIIESFDNFYHSNNKSFKCPQFENDKIGIRILDKNEKGKMFIAGQAFEVNGSYKGLEGVEIFLKEKPPVEYEFPNKYSWDKSNKPQYIFDASRDRTSLTKDSLEAIGVWMSDPNNLSNEDFVNLLNALKPYWEAREKNDNSNDEIHRFINGLLSKLLNTRGYFAINFTENKYVADCQGVGDELKEKFKESGYIICDSAFSSVGMKTIKELVDEARKHKAIKPNEIEKQKILILKDAIKLLAPQLKDLNLFEDDELDPKILIFDKNSEEENDAYENVYAEAIIKDSKAVGFWVDKEHLKDDFSTLLATTLHELTHKFGGDVSSRFSYKLTNVLESVISSMTKEPKIANELKVLECLWNEINIY